MRTTKVNRLLRIFVVMLICSMFLLTNALMVFAAPTVGNTSGMSEESAAISSLSSSVKTAMEGNTYAVDGGGTLSGGDIFKEDNRREGGYTIDGNSFSKLNNKSQNQFISDMADECENVVSKSEEDAGNDGTPEITNETVTNWWKELQTVDGVGSRFLNEILKNTKPDFVTANKWYEPMAPFISAVIGYGCVLIMGVIGLVMVLDLAYINLPPFRLLVSESRDNGGNRRIDASKLITHDAIYAVECAENSRDGGSGGGKQANLTYLGRRVFALIALGICLLYLIHGQIYTLVGMVLDALNGFLGF